MRTLWYRFHVGTGARHALRNYTFGQCEAVAGRAISLRALRLQLSIYAGVARTPEEAHRARLQ